MASIRYPVPGENRVEDLVLAHLDVSIGRVEGTAVVLKDPSVSRLHARIRLTHDGYVIEDNDSANGVWLNGKRVREAPLEDGDEIMIGKTVIVFSDREDPEATVRFNVARPSSGAGKGAEAARPTVPAPPPAGARTVPGDIEIPRPPRRKTGEPAGFWIRLLAYILDSLFMTLLAGVVMIPAALLTFRSQENLALTITVLSAAGLLSTVLFFLYLVLSWARSGATLGKKICGLRVVREDGGGRLGYGKAILRFIGYIISSAILYIGFIMAAFTQRKQALHDMIAGTIVIRTPRS